MVESPKSIVDILKYRSEVTPDRLLYSFATKSPQDDSLTYKQLWEQATKLALTLKDLSSSNDLILITLKPSLNFIICIYACLLAGRPFLPTYPTRSTQDMARANSLIKKYNTSFVICDHAESISKSNYSCPAYKFDDLLKIKSTQKILKIPNRQRSEPLFLQASSGTTRYPRAIMLNDSCLLACLENMTYALNISDHDRGCSWLPPYHDMGLIGSIFLALYANFPVHFMSTSHFITDPLNWLKLITKHRATITAAPNMAYDMCSTAYKKDPSLSIDLSSLRVAINSSEMIRSTTINNFCETFYSSGFKRNTFTSAYGLAEATLMVTCAPPDQAPTIQSFSRSSIHLGTAHPCSLDAMDKVDIVSSGVAVPGMSFEIVDWETHLPRKAYEIGEILVRGNSLTTGYHLDEDNTTETFIHPHFDEHSLHTRTGDSGFTDPEGHLFVIGRIKDYIKTHQGLVSAEEIEHAIDTSLKLDPNYRTASLLLHNQQKSEIIIVKETPRSFDFHKSSEIINKTVNDKFSIHLDKIIFVNRGQVPRTTSGKIKRHATIILVKYDILDILGCWEG